MSVPRHASRTAGFERTSCGGPAVSAHPWCITKTLSHRPITNSMSCSTMTKVTPSLFSALIRSASPRSSVGLTPPAGGSVQQEERRLRDDDEGEFQQLLLAIGQAAGRLVREPREPDEVQHLHRV